MVFKNAQIGETKGITLIELGKGDVQVAYVQSKEGKYVGIGFVNDKPQPIGTQHNTVGTTTDYSKPDALLTFTKVESIEVVEEALKKAKIVLRNL